MVIDRSRRLAAGSMLDAQAERLLGTAAVLVGAFDCSPVHSRPRPGAPRTSST
ncbi:hypothetical protein ACQPZA_26935 [Pseudonocardia xinjiangensis]|uniref:hypothetical protein n=1 Tax=Pseudonocardia xinjiangensis TaxID=75289 RepID=UPI003D8B302A